MQSGYCMMSGNAMSQCYAPDSASCTTVPGCLWTSSCYQQRCSEGDYWCQQRNDALPICGPLVKLLLPASGNSDAPVPLAEVRPCVLSVADYSPQACFAKLYMPNWESSLGST